MDDATGVLSALRVAFDRFFADFDAATRQVDGGWEVIGIHDAVALSESTAALTNAIGFAYLYLFTSIGEVLSELPKGVTLLQAKSTDGSSKPIGAESVRVGRIPSTGVPRLLAALEKAREVVALPAAKQHQKQRWFRGDVISGASLSLLKSAAKSLDLHISMPGGERAIDRPDAAAAATSAPRMSEPLEVLLKRAANVFWIAGQLSDEYADYSQGGFVVHDPLAIERDESKFAELRVSLGGFGDAIKRPPRGFESVAKWLASADSLATKLSGSDEPHAMRESLPAFNSISLGGSQAVSEALKQSQADDPQAFVDEPHRAHTSTPSSSLQEKYPNTTAGNIGFLEFVRDEVRYAAEAKRHQFAKGYPNSTIESMVRGIYWSQALERIDQLRNTLPAEPLEGVARVLRRELSPGTVEQIDGLLSPPVAALRDAWERLRESNAESAVAVVATAGDVWKALDSGQEPKVAGSAMRIRGGGNMPQISFVDDGEEARRLAFERLMAILRSKGGDMAAAMHKELLRVQVSRGLDWASTVNMPLTEFVAALETSTVAPREMLRHAIDNDPAAKQASERTKTFLRNFSTTMNQLKGTSEFQDADPSKRRQWQEFRDAIHRALEQDDMELSSRHLPLPQSIEDWEHLARIVEIPAAQIDEGLTAGQIFDAALAWADRQIIKHKLTQAKTPGRNGKTTATAAPKTKRNRDRPKADYDTVRREAEVASDWERARDAGVYKADFAKERKMSVNDLDSLLGRVAKRKKSSE